LSPNESYPQHIVTAVIVAHDGAAWLPQLADALLGQTRPVQRVVAVDAGSRDRSGAVLASKFGQPAVFGMERSTGYGTAIARALHHRAANNPVPRPVGVGGSQAGDSGGPGGGYGSAGSYGSAGGGYGGYGGYGGRQQSDSDERVEWLWLLHDDCEPAPDALEQLLRGVTETSAAAVLGPKLRDWSNRDVILEAGLTLDTAARRLTGIESREVDQGQHDGDRDALAVSSAGMLIRRDVWDHVGGFDRSMGLFMDDIDFCWRVHSAGYRVRVITDAIVYHAQAATRHRRSISVGRRARMLDRRNGLLTLLGNLPFPQMLKSACGNVLVSVLRIVFFLLAKRLAAAVDEFTALTAVLCHPIRLIKMRRARSRGRRSAYSRVRADVPSGRSGRRLVEFLLAALSKSQPDTVGSHHASADPTEDDSMLIDNGLGRRLLTSPSLFTFIALLAVAIAAGRSLIGSGPLGGGSLVPAWGGASDLWGTYLQTFHPAGVGSTTPAPAWLAVIATLSTLLAGKPWLAIDVIMIGCVPLAGMTAMLAVRKVTTSALVRVWASVTYALLPVATGVIASGRFGAAVAFILLPLIVSQVGRMLTQSGPPAGRAAWATGLLVAIAAAFVPLLWPIIVAVCLVGAIVQRTTPGTLRNLVIASLVPPVLMLPWTLTFLSHPAQLLVEAGLPQHGAPAGGLLPRSLLMLSPGGPGLPPYWVTGGLLAVAFAALFAGRRRRVITAGWGLALAGLLAAVVVSHVDVTSGDVGRVTVWPGLPLALAGLGLLVAAAAGADSLGRLLTGVKRWRALFGGRGPWAALLGLIACSTPVLAAAAWVSNGVSGPVHVVSTPVVPELVAVAAGQTRQVRTLVLTSTGGHVSYLLLRGPGPSLADAAVSPPQDAQRALARAVSALVTPGGGLATDQAQLLANFDIGYILVKAPVDQQLATVLNNVSGVKPYSSTSGYGLWQLDAPPARVSVTEPDGTVVPIPSGPVNVAGARVPAAGGTLILAEPAGGWTVAVDGRALQQVPSPAGSWGEAFRLPRGGGTLTIGRPGLTRELELGLELLAVLVVAGLALPGVRLAEQEELAAAQARADLPQGGRSSRDVPVRSGDQISAGASADADEGRDEAASITAGGGSRTARRKAGRNKAGRNKADRNKARRADLTRELGAEAAADDTGLTRRAAASAGRSGPGSRRGRVLRQREAVAGDSSQRRPGERGGRLADAWPYAAYDLRRADGGTAGARPDAESDARRADGRLADPWPYASADETRDGTRSDPLSSDSWPRAGGRSRRDRSAGPPGRAWSYSDEPNAGDPQDFGSTGPSGRPHHPGERGLGDDHRAGPAGRPPAGPSPVGDWPYPDPGSEIDRDRAPGPGRSPSGRSAAGTWPHTDPGAGDFRSDRRAGGGLPGPGRASRPESGGPRGYKITEPGVSAAPGRYQEPAPADRPERAPADPAGSYDRAPTGRRGRHGTGRGARSDASRRGRERQDRRRPGAEWPEAEQRERESGDPRRGAAQRTDPGRSARTGRESSASSPFTGWRKRGREDREASPARSEPDRWQSGEQPPAWSDDVLEPLPPLDDPGRAQRHGGSAWRSADSAGDWDRFGDDEAAGGRWSPLQPEFEPEYEGDTW
jgi:GT2 family glycosyltransferase